MVVGRLFADSLNSHSVEISTLWFTAPKHGRLKLGNSEDFAQVRSLLHWERIFHVESRAAGCDQMYLDGKDVFLWLPRDNFGMSIRYELCRLFSTTITVTVKLAVVVA